jgi:hypothetical protein
MSAAASPLPIDSPMGVGTAPVAKPREPVCTGIGSVMTGQPRTGFPFERNAWIVPSDVATTSCWRARAPRPVSEMKSGDGSPLPPMPVGERLQQIGIVVHVHRAARLADAARVVGHAQAERHGEHVGRVFGDSTAARRVCGTASGSNAQRAPRPATCHDAERDVVERRRAPSADAIGGSGPPSAARRSRRQLVPKLVARRARGRAADLDARRAGRDRTSSTTRARAGRPRAGSRRRRRPRARSTRSRGRSRSTGPSRAATRSGSSRVRQRKGGRAIARESMSSAVIVRSWPTSFADSGRTRPPGARLRGARARVDASSAAAIRRPAMPAPRPVASDEHDDDEIATAMFAAVVRAAVGTGTTAASAAGRRCRRRA